MTAFIILVTFSLGLGVSMRAIECPTTLCVALRYAQAAESPAVQRFQVWRAPNFQMIKPGNQFVWMAIVDQQFQ